MIANQFIQQGFPVTAVLSCLTLSPRSYYYILTNVKKGRLPSIFTNTLDGRQIPNDIVLSQIKTLLQMEFVDYGYIKVTYWLRDSKKYIINFKKVYRIMREHSWLLSPIQRNKTGKTWIMDFVPRPEVPFEYWEFDIKYIYIHELHKNALLLSVIDVKSRWLMGWILQWSIRKEYVKALLQAIIDDFPTPQSVSVRNDNGSQFESNLIRTFLMEQNIKREFTRPATPQQNAHIESYHSIIEKLICRRYEFVSLENVREVFVRFDRFYNYDRIHSGVGYMSHNSYLLKMGIDLK